MKTHRRSLARQPVVRILEACQLYMWGLPIDDVTRWRQVYQETLDFQPN